MVTVQKIYPSNQSKLIRSSRTFACTLLHHHSTCRSRDTMAEASEGPVPTSTPDSESTLYCRRREERAQRFLNGTSRAAYRLDPLLERSLSTSISDLSQGSESEEDFDDESLHVRMQVKRRVECQSGDALRYSRGCLRLMKALENTLVKQRSTEGVAIHTNRILKDRQEISLVCVLSDLRHC